MIPSLVAREVRESIVEYLTTTFALADPAVSVELKAFLEEPLNGIFRGPFLRIRPPFVTVDSEWVSPLDYFPESWVEDGIRPFKHQADAWARLSSAGGHLPQPTVLTTGTGSGKTEGFEIPVLDHVVRARAAGAPGIKALVLYPMNALASDQAGRFARRVASDSALEGVRVGLFVGMEAGSSTSKAMTAESVVDDQATLLDDPPDILLTNYKMLDRLLTSPSRSKLWQANTPESLAYVVLDEFHTYDGAQGTDVAMLLRRLGSRLGMARTEPDGSVLPLGGACPVGTSATLGSAPSAAQDLREFAGKIFGRPFEDGSLIGESRLSAAKAVGAVEVMTRPDPLVVAKLDPDVSSSLADAVELFTGMPCPTTPDGAVDVIAVGGLMRTHILLRPLLEICGAGPISWRAVSESLAGKVLEWGPAFEEDPAAVDKTVAWLVALISVARVARTDAAGEAKVDAAGAPVIAELFQVEVQLWIREVSRVLRSVATEPKFRWFDEAPDPAAGYEWPSVYCRHCGRSGWATVASNHPPQPGCVGDRLSNSIAATYSEALSRSDRFRSLIAADPSEAGVSWLSADNGQLYATSSESRVPVLVMAESAGARSQRCPSCGNDDAVRFLGSAVTSLASVTVSQLFGSQLVEDRERKLIAFADSVQDAAHRAGFFTGRAHRFNLRSLVAGHLREVGEPVPLSELANTILAKASSPADRFTILPPDLHRSPKAATLLTDEPSEGATEMLLRRVSLELDLELGLRSRFGRTLELTGAAVAWVHVADDVAAELPIGLAELAALVTSQEALELDVALPDDGAGFVTGSAEAWNVWFFGLLDRTRLQGGIAHPWFDVYFAKGDVWTIWGGRPEGMPAFPQGMSRPRPPATRPAGPDRTGDFITTGSWFDDWSKRCLGIAGPSAVTVTRAAFGLAAENGIVTEIPSGGERVWVLPPSNVMVVDVVDPTVAVELECGVCHHRHHIPTARAAAYAASPCLRFQCPGRYVAGDVDYDNFYRGFYRSGRMRRVVAEAHTGLLSHDERNRIESQFKNPTTPDAPNVLTATPTLEMGIDIGDLSAVMLTSIPRKQASHAQRIGRAGRKSGNSLVTTFAGTDPLSLYYLSEPEAMLSGDIRPPDCYLDATEILARHLLGFLVDRAAIGAFDAGAIPHSTAALMSGWGTNGWLELLVTHAEQTPATVNAFLDLFTGTVHADVAAWVRSYAATGMRQRVASAVGRWRDELSVQVSRRNRLRARIKELEESAEGPETASDLNRLRGERRAADGMLKDIRDARVLDTLERLGLFPNYTLTEDTVTFRAQLYFQNEEGEYDTIKFDLDRSASAAIYEFAPGASFYAGQYKLTVDTLHIGTRSEPLYETFRTCPQCAYATIEAPDAANPGPCPRCGANGFADNAASVRTLLRLRTVSCTQSESDSRVYDERDEREQVPFDRFTTVDIDPGSVTDTWSHNHQTFAFEYSDKTVLRTYNLGLQNRPGTSTVIAGYAVEAAWFHVCRDCGIVRGVRPQRNGMERHAGFCSAKRGNTPEFFDAVGLYHETTTEAVRILLPIHDLESDARIASFKAALTLGLRESFGGDPDHLRIVVTDYPTADPEVRQRLLVVHDTVTGGTGYVRRLADPEQMRSILESARKIIATCPCVTTGRPACHRCLLGAAERRDIPNVTRTAALEIIDPLLQDWAGAPSATPLTGIDISGIRQSELEQKFKRLLHLLGERVLPWGTTTTVVPIPAGQGRTRFDVRFNNPDGTTTRWRIEEQVAMPTHPATVADFVATRVDTTGYPDIVIYLDGYRYHASEAHNSIAADHDRRAALRDTGRVVWLIDWDPINDIERAWTDGTEPAPSRSWPTKVLTKANEVHAAMGGIGLVSPKDRAGANPFLTLMAMMCEPDLAGWRSSARSVLLGWFQALTAVEIHGFVADLDDTEAAFLHIGGFPTVTESASVAFVASAGHLRVLCGYQKAPNGPIRFATVVPDVEPDLADDQHRERWAASLHIANLVQFLDAAGDSHTIIAASRVAETAQPGLVVAATAPATAPSDESTAALIAELIVDPATVTIVAAAVAAGAPLPEGGYEPDLGFILEAAWPDQKIGIYLDGVHQPGLNQWALMHGWDIRTSLDWTGAELAAAVKEPA